MNTKKVLNKLYGYSGIEKTIIELDGQKITVIFKDFITDVHIAEIAADFPFNKYDYKLKSREGKIALEFSDRGLNSFSERLGVKSPFIAAVDPSFPFPPPFPDFQKYMVGVALKELKESYNKRYNPLKQTTKPCQK
ncbi:hypothetical protein BAS06_09300 [Elizabethkingia miricola]|uniref:hypothetical protein n=1 Tax=Elizabethkingia miricola TaxID=172045 RepID=UPI000999332F|nr:hypothetical protein [Elizabethkingia miricola]MDV3880753.1 hypothetical protein [Elizabethkingia anophelis]OPB90504.1 hypothetical protein BAS06_09300 [Elizabethkingia miricola]